MQCSSNKIILTIIYIRAWENFAHVLSSLFTAFKKLDPNHLQKIFETFRKTCEGFYYLPKLQIHEICRRMTSSLFSLIYLFLLVFLHFKSFVKYAKYHKFKSK